MLRVALATLWDGGERYRCALPLWCRSAQALQATIGGGLHTIIISPVSGWDECGSAVRTWSSELVDAIQAYSRGKLDGSYLQLMKLIIFSLTTFHVVIFTDLDTDPHNQWRGVDRRGVAQWVPSLTAFNISRALFACTADHQSPVNGGALVVKPREWLYAEALETLRRNLSFDPTLGFNSVGRPRSLHPETGLILEGSGMSAAAVASKLNKTVMFSTDSWRFVGSNVDQCACHAPARFASLQESSLSKCLPSRTHVRVRVLAGASFGTCCTCVIAWARGPALGPACGLRITGARISHGVRAASRARRLLLTTSGSDWVQTRPTHHDAWVPCLICAIRGLPSTTPAEETAVPVALAAFSHWPRRPTRTLNFSRCCRMRCEAGPK